MTGAPRRPLPWYRSTGLATRWHVAGRWLTGPFGPIEALLPEAGRILDWGCGHGVLAIWAAALAEGRTIEGVDIDGAKLLVAQDAAARAGVSDRMVLRTVLHDATPDGQWDAIVLNDVLYLMDPTHQEQVVRAAARSVAPGGLVVCKELGRRPGWKWRLSRLQEHLAVRGLRITATGHGLQAFPEPDAVAGWLAGEGLSTTVDRLDRGYHVPHVAVLGRRPG